MFFPFQHNPYPWISNINKESPTDCFKSVFTKYLYIHKINTFAASGVSFIENGYFPEECKETKEFLYEREDHGHLLKRLTNTFRQGHMRPRGVLEFMERKGYVTEFNVEKVARKWHRAVDGRGFK